MTKTTVKTITIQVMAKRECSNNGSYIDFCIAVNGEKFDADLYRIYSWENEFHKILGFTSYGHAVRGKARKAATELILDMRRTSCPIGIIEL